MEMRHLRYFVTVAEELSFSRAAERLHVSQPSLSSQIKKLEEELGVGLFDRSRRRIRLTDAGRFFLEQSQRLFAELERDVRAVRRVGRGEVGRLTLGFVPAAANDALPPLLRVFRGRFPDVELSMHEMNPGQLVDALHDKRIDAAFFYVPFEDPALEFATVLRESLVLVLPDEHPLAAEREVDVRALANEPFVLPAPYRGAGLREKIEELCQRSGFVPRVVQEAWLVQTAAGLTASGVGVTMVPASLQNLQKTGVVYKRVRGLPAEVELGVVWRRDEASAVLRSFLGVVEEARRDDARGVGVRVAGAQDLTLEGV